jgi:hypothetical protein
MSDRVFWQVLVQLFRALSLYEVIEAGFRKEWKQGSGR